MPGKSASSAGTTRRSTTRSASSSTGPSQKRAWEEGRRKRQGRKGWEDRVSKLTTWAGRAHTAASMSALPLAYVVRAANVNDKDVVKPLLKQASRLIKRCGKRISQVIADRQYYSTHVFTAIRELRAEPVIPYPLNVKDRLINLWVTKRFKVRGDSTLVNLYKLRMTVERGFKAAKLELMMENLRWRGIAKIRMHVAICFTCMYAVAITAHKIGRPELANSIASFTY